MSICTLIIKHTCHVPTYAKTLENDDARRLNPQHVPLHLLGGWLPAAALVDHHHPAVDASFGESSISYQRQSPWLLCQNDGDRCMRKDEK